MIVEREPTNEFSNLSQIKKTLPSRPEQAYQKPPLRKNMIKKSGKINLESIKYEEDVKQNEQRQNYFKKPPLSIPSFKSTEKGRLGRPDFW